MKKLLLWNGILSIIYSTAVFALIAFSVFTIINKSFDKDAILVINIVMAIFAITSIILGVITLFKCLFKFDKSEKSGLIIASGVLASIGLSSAFFINAIVSFIAYRKEK